MYYDDDTYLVFVVTLLENLLFLNIHIFWQNHLLLQLLAFFVLQLIHNYFSFVLDIQVFLLYLLVYSMALLQNPNDMLLQLLYNLEPLVQKE